MTEVGLRPEQSSEKSSLSARVVTDALDLSAFHFCRSPKVRRRQRKLLEARRAERRGNKGHERTAAGSQKRGRRRCVLNFYTPSFRGERGGGAERVICAPPSIVCVEEGKFFAPLLSSLLFPFPPFSFCLPSLRARGSYRDLSRAHEQGGTRGKVGGCNLANVFFFFYASV